MPSALPELDGQFSRDEAQDIADAICDSVADGIPNQPMTVRWAIEEAVLNAFGYSGEEEDSDV